MSSALAPGSWWNQLGLHPLLTAFSVPSHCLSVLPVCPEVSPQIIYLHLEKKWRGAKDTVTMEKSGSHLNQAVKHNNITNISTNLIMTLIIRKSSDKLKSTRPELFKNISASKNKTKQNKKDSELF